MLSLSTRGKWRGNRASVCDYLPACDNYLPRRQYNDFSIIWHPGHGRRILLPPRPSGVRSYWYSVLGALCDKFPSTYPPNASGTNLLPLSVPGLGRGGCLTLGLVLPMCRAWSNSARSGKWWGKNAMVVSNCCEPEVCSDGNPNNCHGK